MFNSEAIFRYLSRVISRSVLPIGYYEIDLNIIETAYHDFIPDYKRWFPTDPTIDEHHLLLTPQLGAMLCYRIAHAVSILPPPPNPSTGLNNVAASYSLLGREIGQIEIYYSAEIDSGLKINHGVGSVIGARCKIGKNCTIHQNCTLGDRNGGRPTIGNNVMIYAGSMILGNITIGDGSIIGANSIVLDDCPPNSILIGTPAKIVKVNK